MGKKTRLYQYVMYQEYNVRVTTNILRVIHSAFRKTIEYKTWWEGSTGAPYKDIFFPWLVKVQPYELQGDFNDHELIELFQEADEHE